MTCLRVGWSLAHCTWAAAYVLVVRVGAEDRFCSPFDRPISNGGPFGSWSGEVGAARYALWLLGAGLLAAVGLLVLTVASVRRALLASVTNGLLWLVGAAVVFGLAASQFDDGRFCSGVSLIVGLAGLVTLVGLAVLVARLLHADTRSPTPEPVDAAMDQAG